MGVDQVGIDKVGIDKVGIDEVGRYLCVFILLYIHDQIYISS